MYSSNVILMEPTKEKAPTTLGAQAQIDLLNQKDNAIEKPMEGMNFWGQGAYKDDFISF